ncbi:MAG: tail fiber protein [Acidimicrobiia bacterium]|nr:tail fiber protein [Acidimicrobiia bacterium]
MAEPFLAEIRLFGFSFPPRGWALCDGQILPIDQNQSLFSLLGTTYGGDGRTTFALPDLRGRTPVHRDSGAGYSLGAKAGEEGHPLTVAEIPSHTHTLQGSSANANATSPAGAVYARAAATVYRDPASNPVPMNAGAIANAGTGQPHDNMQPFLTVSYCIAVTGTFPSRN